MLIIRDAQRDAFVEERVRTLRGWLGPHLRRHFPDRLQGTDDDALGALIHASVARARAHGASRAETICRFVHLWVLFGEGLETLPWAAQTLADPALTDPDARMEILSRRARAALALEAARS